MNRMNKHGGYYGGLDVMDYSVNINPLGLPRCIKESIINSIDSIDKYPDIQGNSAKEAIGQHLHIDNNKIIMGNGASELIYLFARAIQPKKVLIIEPTFNEYRRAFSLVGSHIEEYILDYENDFKWDMDKFDLTMSTLKPDVVVLCNPNNPTGKFLELDEVTKIVEIINKEDSFLFIDESFIEFTGKESVISNIPYDNVLSLRSMTKYYAVPGLRIGYVVSNESVVQKMEEYKEPWTMNTFALNIVPGMIQDSDFHESVGQWIRDEREYMYKALNGLDNLKVYKSLSNFFLCRLNYCAGNMLNLQLLEKKMYVRVCEDFKSLDDGFVRIAVKKREDNEKLIGALKEILEDKR